MDRTRYRVSCSVPPHQSSHSPTITRGYLDDPEVVTAIAAQNSAARIIYGHAPLPAALVDALDFLGLADSSGAVESDPECHVGGARGVYTDHADLHGEAAIIDFVP